MKKFSFTLRPVLEHRKRIEEEKQLVVAERQRDLSAAQNELARLNGRFKEYAERLRSGHMALSTEELRAHYAHLEFLDRAMTMQHAVISQCRFALDRAREELLEAAKDRKIIEKLKERRLGEYRALEQAEEQKALDDSNNRRYARTHP